MQMITIELGADNPPQPRTMAEINEHNRWAHWYNSRTIVWLADGEVSLNVFDTTPSGMPGFAVVAEFVTGHLCADARTPEGLLEELELLPDELREEVQELVLRHRRRERGEVHTEPAPDGNAIPLPAGPQFELTCGRKILNDGTAPPAILSRATPPPGWV